MRNIHPLFKPALAPYALPPVAMIPFAVRLNVGGKPQELNILPSRPATPSSARSTSSSKPTA